MSNLSPLGDQPLPGGFHSNGGGDLEDMEVEWNSTIPEPKKLERKDHIFVNWFRTRILRRSGISRGKGD